MTAPLTNMGKMLPQLDKFDFETNQIPLAWTLRSELKMALVQYIIV